MEASTETSQSIAQQNSAEKGAKNTSFAASSDENSAVAASSDETSAVAGSSDENSACAASSDKTAAVAGLSDENTAVAASNDKTSAVAGSSDENSAVAASSDKTSAVAGSSDENSAVAASNDKTSAVAASSDENSAVAASSDETSAVAAFADQTSDRQMSVGLQRRVPALDEGAGGVPASWKGGNSEPPFPSFAPAAGSPAGPAFAASPAPSTPGPAPGFGGGYAAPGPFPSPSARPASAPGFPPPGGPPPQHAQGHFPGPGFAPPGSPFHPHAPHPPMPPHPHMMAPLPPPVDRRHGPYFGQPDYRVYELNKRLQQRTEDSDNLWWDAFATEFFEDDATLTLTFCLEDGPKRYTIGRTLIPRYFRSIYEGGVSELYYTMRQPKESFHNTSITLDCDHCTMVTHHGKPMFTKVCTEGRLILEFTFDDLMRIKSWHMAVRTHRELIPRQAVHPPDHAALDQLSKNITRQGITNSTLNYLRLCVILEPMQELMSRHKAYALSPRDCLKTTLFQKWQRMVAPPESQRPASKRRKRKGSAGANAAPPAPAKKRSPGPNFTLASQDVMVVGEPSLMGGEFGDEDERLITRLENTQYEGDEWSAPPPASPAKTPPAAH